MNNMPKTSKAAVLREYNKPLEICDVKIPSLNEGDMLVSVLLSGICGTDKNEYMGLLADKVYAGLPIIPGHEALGRVEKIGGNVDLLDATGNRVKIGDRILWSHMFCHKCFTCTILGEPSKCIAAYSHGYGFGSVEELHGGYSEYEIVLKDTDFIIVPEELEDEEVLGVACAFRSSMHGYMRLLEVGGVKPGDSVVVQGCGPIGLYALVCLAQTAASRIIVIGAPAVRLELAREWGATDIIDIDEIPDPEARHRMIMELTGGKGANVIVEASGFTSSFVEGCNFAAVFAKYLVLGIGIQPTSFQSAVLCDKNMTIVGSGGADIKHYYYALEFIKAYRHKYPFAKMVSNTYRIEQANEALDAMFKGTNIKPTFDNRIKL